MSLSPQQTHGRLYLSALLLALLSGCAETTKNRDDGTLGAGGEEPDTPRVKPRLVSIELPVVVHRSSEKNDDGSIRWGDPEPIDEAEACVVERRDAYSPFRPFETLDPPICATGRAGELVRITHVPANSDLTISVSKPGYLPTVFSLRVDTNDVLQPGDFTYFLTPLFDEAQAALFSVAPGQGAGGSPAEPDDADADARIALEPGMIVLFPHDPFPEGQTLLYYGSDSLPASDARMSLTAVEANDSATLDVEGQALLLDVSSGTYRIRIDQPRAFCEPAAYIFGYTLYGLSTDAPEEIEVRALPGHVSFASFMCVCAPPAVNVDLVNPMGCTFTELEP